jgi:hypothetical protein
MSFNHSYVSELETLIVEVLLPVYANYQTRMGSSDRYAGINPELLKRIKIKKQVPMLFKPFKNE